MGHCFDALSLDEKRAVTEYAHAEYDRLVFQKPASYISHAAQSDPERWRNSFRELIASDPLRVRAIVETAQQKVNTNRGFTLIELSIVLVIVGLIIGGVLVGRDLIHSATIRSQIAQLEQFTNAIETFQIKYDCLAGDCSNASIFLPGAVNGNGDGIAGDGSWPPSSATTSETMNIFPQLGSAQMFAGNYSNVASTQAIPNNFPANKIGRGGMFPWGVSLLASGLSLSLRPNFDLTQGWQYADNFTPREALAIDTKIDDGHAATGRLQTDDWIWASGHDDCLADDNDNAQSDYTYIAIKMDIPTCAIDFYYSGSVPVASF